MTNKRLNVAVFFGGHSSEYSISLQSAYSVICNLDPKKYHPLPVGISPEGRWFFFRGDWEKILNDTWCNPEDCVPALLSPNRGEKALYLLEPDGIRTVSVDAALPIMHGKFGEDGTLQGYIALSGIPLVGCGVLSSALCMDKDRAHKLAALAGILVPKSVALCKGFAPEAVLTFAKDTGYPLFVKPIKSGSSYGVTRVEREDQLLRAVELAFTFDDAPSKTLESVLAVFAAYNQTSPTCKATATLFCNGIRINAASKQLLSAAHALKFELGNHSHSHADLTTLSNFDLQWETDATDALLYQIDGKSRHLFRAPFGKINEHVRSYAHTPIIDWTIDTLDWTNATAEKIYERVWSQKFSGAIVLMHDGYPSTVEALKRLLPDLRDAGYQAVSVSAMAKAHECPLRRGGVYIRARKKRS